MTGQRHPQPTSPPRSPDPPIEQPSQSSIRHIRLKSNPDLQQRQQANAIQARYDSNNVKKRLVTTVDEPVLQSPEYVQPSRLKKYQSST